MVNCNLIITRNIKKRWSSFPIHPSPLQAIHQNHKPKKEEKLVLCMCLIQLSRVNNLRVGQSERVGRFHFDSECLKLSVLVNVEERLQGTHCETSKTKENQCHSCISCNCSTDSLASLQVDKLKCKCKGMNKMVFFKSSTYKVKQ